MIAAGDGARNCAIVGIVTAMARVKFAQESQKSRLGLDKKSRILLHILKCLHSQMTTWRLHQ